MLFCFFDKLTFPEGHVSSFPRERRLRVAFPDFIDFSATVKSVVALPRCSEFKGVAAAELLLLRVSFPLCFTATEEWGGLVVVDDEDNDVREEAKGIIIKVIEIGKSDTFLESSYNRIQRLKLQSTCCGWHYLFTGSKVFTIIILVVVISSSVLVIMMTSNSGRVAHLLSVLLSFLFLLFGNLL